MAGQRAVVKLLSAEGKRELDYAFPLNPSSIDRSRRNMFADIPLAEHSGGWDEEGDLSQWTGTIPQSIRVSFLLHSTGADDVEGEIDALERLMVKDGATGRPPIMLFVEGKKRDKGWVESVDWSPAQWTPDLRRQVVRGSMTFKVLRPYQPSGGRPLEFPP